MTMLALQKQSRIKHHGKFKNPNSLALRRLRSVIRIRLVRRIAVPCICATGMVCSVFYQRPLQLVGDQA